MSLLTPESDIQDRAPIWNAMQMIYMDTDSNYEFEGIASVCADSKYTLEDLENILFNEVRPAVRFNLFMFPAPEWRGFELEWLTKRVLEKHNFGRRKPIFFGKYAKQCWSKLAPLIEEKRENS